MPMQQISAAHQLATALDDFDRRLGGIEHWGPTYWSLYRARAPILEALAAPWRSMSTEALLELPAELYRDLEQLDRNVGRFSAWVQSTEAMPARLEARLTRFLTTHEALVGQLRAALGVAPGDTFEPGVRQTLEELFCPPIDRTVD